MRGRLQHTAFWVATLFFVIGGAVAWKVKPVHQWTMYTTGYWDKVYDPWYPMLSENAFYEVVAEYCGYRIVLAGNHFQADPYTGEHSFLTINANHVLVHSTMFTGTDVEIRDEPDLDWIRSQDDPMLWEIRGKPDSTLERG